MSGVKSSWADESEELLEQETLPPKPVNAWSRGNPLAETPSQQETFTPVGFDKEEFPDIKAVKDKKKERYEPSRVERGPSGYERDRSERDQGRYEGRERNYDRGERRERDYDRGERRERDFGGERRERDYDRGERRDYNRYDRDRRERDYDQQDRKERGHDFDRLERGDRFERRDRDDHYERRDRHDDRQRRDYGSRDRRDFGRGFRDRDNRKPSKPREPLPIPTSPPFTAFVGNLPFDVHEEEIQQFFSEAGIVPKNVRLIQEKNSNKHKGFSYVEFEDAEALKEALKLNDQELMGRPLRVDVAEQKTEERKWERPAPQAAEPLSPTSVERPKLNLKPPSAKVIPEPSVSEAYSKSKFNPFGDAKPRDENFFLQKKEEERKKREKDHPEEETPEGETPEESPQLETSPEEKAVSPEKKQHDDRRPSEGRRFSDDRKVDDRFKDRSDRKPFSRDRDRRPPRRESTDRFREDRRRKDDRRNSSRGGYRRDEASRRRDTNNEMPKAEKESAPASISENPFDALDEEQF